MPTPRIPLPKGKIADWCVKWKVMEFSLFGSVLTDHFGPDSDVDVMVSFAQDEDWSLFDLVDMKDELKEIIGRKVDLVTRRSIESSKNPFRKKAILESVEPYHVSG